MLFNSKKRTRGINNQYTVRSAYPQNEGKQSSSATAREIGERFNVSKATIERDGKVAQALKAIAEVSVDAKRKVLSGEVLVDRSKLQRLSRASKEELEEVANQINEGTYNRKDHRISRTPDASNTQDRVDDNARLASDFPDVSQRDYVDTIVSLITGNLNTTLKSLNNESGIPELKTSLRTFITNLEELYSNIK